MRGETGGMRSVHFGSDLCPFGHDAGNKGIGWTEDLIAEEVLEM